MLIVQVVLVWSMLLSIPVIVENLNPLVLIDTFNSAIGLFNGNQPLPTVFQASKNLAKQNARPGYLRVTHLLRFITWCNATKPFTCVKVISFWILDFGCDLNYPVLFIWINTIPGNHREFPSILEGKRQGLSKHQIELAQVYGCLIYRVSIGRDG